MDPTREVVTSSRAVRTGICVKCSADEVFVVHVTDQIEGDRLGSLVGLEQEAYVCGGCGYVEFYARDLATVRRIGRVVKPMRRAPFR